ncbi:MAG: isoprenylcysteine carboxylmethyltransferase family protein [Deltaproteobacteria bacterium]|nr:isoprenylcysteine carboxylmethyltransferase family protein [Deltaproteobacteria bacterium]
MSRGIRPSTTRSTAALWAKSLLNALLFFAIFMVAAPFGARCLLPSSLPAPGWLHGAAAVLFIAGMALWAVCLDVFSRRGRGTPFPLDAPRELATSGPFAIVRNPIMVAELAVIWAEAFYLSTLGVYLYAVVATLAGWLAVIFVEEPELRQRFGARYEEYCSRVPRWLPRLRTRQSVR